MNPFISAFANLCAAAVGGAFVCYFLAHQRTCRLKWQLGELSKEIRGVYESKPQIIFESRDEKKARWGKSLDEIIADVESGADRFVRLNAKTTRMLKVLFDGLEHSPSVLELLGYSRKERQQKATYEDVAVWIDELRQSIDERCFFELPFEQ